MKIRQYPFGPDAMYAYLEKLSIDFNVSLYDKVTLKIPPDKGSGLIKNIFLEENFCIRYYQLYFHTPTPFYWFYDGQADKLLYKLMFTCSPTPVSFPVENTQQDEKECITGNNVVLYSVDPILPQTIPANEWTTKIALIFTTGWLIENFMDASSKITEIIKLLGKKNMPSYINQVMNYSYYGLVREMAKEMDKDTFPIIHIKTKSLILLNEFLNKVVEASETMEQKSLYYDTIIRVEQRLKQFLLTTMPGIAQLSSEFNMSPSTLQRHFKMVYGKNIYHYYLEQKLAIGKEMIASRKKSISEVAYMLGYHKINSFSKVFKKYFGVLPRDIHSIKK